MNMERMAELLKGLQEKEDFLRQQGQKEYAHDGEDAFANFDRVGNLVKVQCEHCHKPTRIGRLGAWAVYFLKHVDGVMSWIGGHRSQRESVTGRIEDQRVYLALLYGMVEEEEQDEAFPGKLIIK